MLRQQRKPLPLRVRECANCGIEFEGKGRAKFCSGKCRKAQYATPCVRCGGTTSGSEGRRPDTLCRTCGALVGGEAGGRINAEKAFPRREAMARRWREGASLRDLANEFDMAEGTVCYHISTLRSLGWDIPVRHFYPHHREAA